MRPSQDTQNGRNDNEILGFFLENEAAILRAWSDVEGDSTMPYDYQKPGDGISKLIIRGIKYFSGESVLDIGCNNGINSLAASFVASKVVGCDYSDTYIRRAIAGKHFMSTKRSVENLEFECGDFTRFLDPSISAILA